MILDGAFSHVAASFVRPELIGEGIFEGHEDLRRLDHGGAEVRSYVADVMRYWLDQGATGWRLDAAYSVDSEFWREVLHQVRTTHPHAFIFDEVIHGDYAQIIADTSMDSVTQYELWKAIWSSLKDENFFELDWCIKRHNVSTGLALPSISPRNTKADHRGRRNAQEHRIRQHQP